MNGWQEVTLREVSDRVDYGYTASAVDDPDLPRLLRITDIAQTYLDWSAVPGCSIDPENLNKYALEAGDIVVARTGATVGYAKRIRSHPLSVFASYLVRFRMKPGINPSYVGAIVESKDYKQWVLRNAGGAAQPNANARVLGSYHFHLPDRETQNRIGAIFDLISDLIDNNRRRIGLLEEMARAIYREWFVKFRYPGNSEVPLVDSELGPIPEDWDVQPFDEVADFINGFAFKPAHWESAGRPIIKIKELKNGVLAATPRHPAEAIAQKFWVERGDLLFSWSADLAVYIWNDEPGLLNQHLFVVRPTRPNITVQFLFFALEEAMHKFQARAQGTTMRHIKRSALTEVSIRIPSDSLLSQFADHVDPLLDEVGRLRQEISILTSLRDLLLPKLVTGQIDISKLDLDVLLENEVA